MACCLKLVVAALWTAHQCSAGIPHVKCVDVKHKCLENVECSMAWHSYRLRCKDVVDGDVQSCTVSCQRAITVMLSSQGEIGRRFTNCSCDVLHTCDDQRRLNFCSQFVLGLLDTLGDTTVVGCSSARIMCEADAACHTAFQMYMSQCKTMNKSLECKKECTGSLKQLYRQTRAAKLKSCRCDYDPEYDECETIHRSIDACRYQNTTYSIAQNARAAAQKLNYAVEYSFVPVVTLYILHVYVD